jgi:hypothetical protein
VLCGKTIEISCDVATLVSRNANGTILGFGGVWSQAVGFVLVRLDVIIFLRNLKLVVLYAKLR